MVVAQEGAGREAAGQGAEHEAGRMAAPLLFSLADQDAAPALVMRRGGRGCQDGGNNKLIQFLWITSYLFAFDLY